LETKTEIKGSQPIFREKKIEAFKTPNKAKGRTLRDQAMKKIIIT